MRCNSSSNSAIKNLNEIKVMAYNIILKYTIKYIGFQNNIDL